MSKLENKNAVKHGAFAVFLIMPDEDPNEFEALLAALAEEWNPEGRCENEKIESIAMSMWRKRRFRKHMRKVIAKLAGKEALVDRIQDRDTERMMNILEQIESGIPGCITEESLLEKLGPRWANRFKKSCPRADYTTEEAWLNAISDLICKVQEDLELTRSQMPTIGETYSAEWFNEREQDFEERIDAKIDRDLKQLGQIKTIKAIGIGRRPPAVDIGPLKQIEAPSVQAAE